MKALEMNNLLLGKKDSTHIKKHRKYLEQARACTDTSEPKSHLIPGSPRKKDGNLLAREQIAKNNLHLAQRIFNIMEGPGLISNLLQEQRPGELHPGTLNFNNRIREAKRIHQDNVQLAARLDAVKSFSAKNKLSVVKPVKASTKIKLKKVPKIEGFESLIQKEHAVSKSARPVRGGEFQDGSSSSARQSKSARSASDKANKMNNVLLEYTKIQGGRVIDVAVIKEPFRDRYAIFGIDIENGQRYELRLSSEDVSSILDGDILVTSIENIEVWMTLLNKIELVAVDAFTKLPTFIGPETAITEDQYDKEFHANRQEIVATPAAPAQQRPSSKPGGRSGRLIQHGSVSSNGSVHTYGQMSNPSEFSPSQSREDGTR